MSTYQTPGVYYERADAAIPVLSPIRMDIAGFVGLALRGPLDTPVPLQSWRQFLAFFGGFAGTGFLAYTVRAFFENGGKRCWVVRVASKEPTGGAAMAGITVQSPTGMDVWRIAASSPGVWGNGLSIFLKETHRMQTMTDPFGSTPEASVVVSPSGFTRGTMVRLSQGGLTPVWKVVSDVDAMQNLLVWINEKPELRLPYDSPLEGFDRNRPILIESVEYTLGVSEPGHPIALYENLSLVPGHERYGPLLLPALTLAPEKEARGVLPPVPFPVMIQELRLLPLIQLEPMQPVDEFSSLAGGAEGLALLSTYDFIGEDISPWESDEIQAQKRRGLQALNLVEEVAMVAIPDIQIVPELPVVKAPLPPCIPDPCLPKPDIPATPALIPVNVEVPPVFSEADIYQVQAALVQHCEDRRDRIALLDAPRMTALDNKLGISAIRAWRQRFDSRYAALYYPWVSVVDPLRSSAAITREIPPCGHVAGQYANADFTVGVHKAPANALLNWVQDVTMLVDDAMQGVLNPVGINVIRLLIGRGIRIFGARTVSSDPDWRYINVRRLLIMIEKAFSLSTQWAVFELNDVHTRTRIRLSLLSFLVELWQRGALQGSTVDEAFFVKCDDTNNPPELRNNGHLLAEVGVAPSQPFEFIVVRVGRTDNEFEISEYPLKAGGK